MEIITYLGWFLAIGVAVWAGIHGMQKLTKWNDRRVAIAAAVLGAVSGLLIHAIGFIRVPAPGRWAWVCSAFFGLLTAFAAAGGADINLIKATISKGGE